MEVKFHSRFLPVPPIPKTKKRKKKKRKSKKSGKDRERARESLKERAKKERVRG
jgi:hypothetical protein